MSSGKVDRRNQSLQAQASVSFDESSPNPALHSCYSLAPTKIMSSKLFRATYERGAHFHLTYDKSSCSDAELVRQTEGEHTRRDTDQTQLGLRGRKTPYVTSGKTSRQ